MPVRYRVSPIAAQSSSPMSTAPLPLLVVMAMGRLSSLTRAIVRYKSCRKAVAVMEVRGSPFVGESHLAVHKNVRQIGKRVLTFGRYGFYNPINDPAVLLIGTSGFPLSAMSSTQPAFETKSALANPCCSSLFFNSAKSALSLRA